jgi:DNA-binding CsgD family transcriptional regulator
MPRRQADTLRCDAWGASLGQPDSVSGKAVELTDPHDQFGYCLLSASNRVIAATDRASRLLNYPWSDSTQLNASCMQRIQVLANARQRADGTTWRGVLRSGRRQYLCRAIPLTTQSGVPLDTPTLLLIERPGASQMALSRLATDFHLTTRQVELVDLLARGLTNKQIANAMGLSAHTVKTHLHFIMVKLRISTRAGIVGALITRMA